MGEALERWAALVRTRREQMEAQQRARGDQPDDWWAGRAGMLAEGIGDRLRPPPWGVEQIAARLERRDALLDVGGGAGRYAVPLLRSVARLDVLEPSPSLASLAREHLEATPGGASSVREASWPEAAADLAERYDAVLLAHVLYPHEDLRGWIEAALETAGRWLFIVHGTVPDAPGAIGDLVEHLHGERRIRQPEIGDLIPALHELGVYPDVRMGLRRFTRAFDAETYPEELAMHALVAPEPATLRRIRKFMEPRLQRLDDGRVGLPPVVAPVGLLTWRTGN